MDERNSNKRLREIIGILSKYNLVTGMTPENLTAMLAELGPTFVKVGQIMSMQPAILPVAYCKELENLRTNVAPMDYDTVRAILETEYGTSLDEIFSDIDPMPLGAASIAQAHMATLVDGKKVVVKIQRPGIYETMYHDILLIKKAAGLIKFVARIGGEIDINMIIDEIWAVAKQEMDFIVEAENTREFYTNNIDVAFVSCPEIINEYSTSKILVMEYIDGFFINDFSHLKDNSYDLEEIAGKLAHNFVKQVIDDGFFHADPHCGNILIRNGKIIWIDLGMMGRLSPRDKKLFADAVVAIGNNDIAALTDFALKIGVYKEKISYAALSSDIETILNKYGTIDFRTMDLIEMSDDFLMILNKHKIGIPRGVSMLARAMSTIQGTLRTLYPDINFIQIIADYMTGYYIKSLDLKKELSSIMKSLNFSFRKSLDIPVQISDLLKMFSKGTSKVNVELNMSDNMTGTIGKMLNRIVAAMIVCALLIGSSLLCTTDIQPKIAGIPALGVFGFTAAFILGIWILITAIKKK